MRDSVILISSNKNKLEEYRSYGLPFEVKEGVDIKEIAADSITVAIYKSLDAGNNTLIEDSILRVDGEEIVDIRWRLHELVKVMQTNDCTIQWIVTFAHNINDQIQLYQSTLDCEIIQGVDFDNIPDDAFMFDPFLKPKGCDDSLYELSKNGEKHLYSPRFGAIQKFLKNEPYMSIDAKYIPKWEGKYQNE